MIRRARPDDVPEMLAIKRALPMDPTGRGGFLLGTDAAGYAALVGAARVWVFAPAPEAPVQALAVMMPDEVLRASALWAKRSQIQGADLSALEASRIGYFDQLAARPGVDGRWSASLAIRGMRDLVRDHEHVFCTTVREPVVNRAALSMMARIGFQRVGRVDEVYPEVGALVSDVHYISQATFLAQARSLLRGTETEQEIARRAGVAALK